MLRSFFKKFFRFNMLLLLICGTVLPYVLSGCGTGLSENTFSFRVFCEQSESQDGKFTISCELENKSSNSYTILHGGRIFYCFADGEAPLVASPAVTSVIEGHKTISDSVSVRIKEKGEHTITVIADFAVWDPEGKRVLKDFRLEKGITVSVTG